MLGKWDGWYKTLTQMGSFRYGNTVSYKLAEQFLGQMDVEDWGCGAGGFRRIHKGGYIGIDGSKNKFVDVVADLEDFISQTDGLMMRHVLEHNYAWEKVLDNAIASFRKRMCLVIFTPFDEVTHEIDHNLRVGVDAPTLAFKREDIEKHFVGLKVKLLGVKSKTAYGIENIYFLAK